MKLNYAISKSEYFISSTLNFSNFILSYENYKLLIFLVLNNMRQCYSAIKDVPHLYGAIFLKYFNCKLNWIVKKKVDCTHCKFATMLLLIQTLGKFCDTN